MVAIVQSNFTDSRGIPCLSSFEIIPCRQKDLSKRPSASPGAISNSQMGEGERDRFAQRGWSPSVQMKTLAWLGGLENLGVFPHCSLSLCLSLSPTEFPILYKRQRRLFPLDPRSGRVGRSQSVGLCYGPLAESVGKRQT